MVLDRTNSYWVSLTTALSYNYLREKPHKLHEPEGLWRGKRPLFIQNPENSQPLDSYGTNIPVPLVRAAQKLVKTIVQFYKT